MTNSKNTKRALFASILSMLLCAAMLVCSTLAWFTDSVVSGRNVITSGNLNISASYRNVDKYAATGGYEIPGFTRSVNVIFEAAAHDINAENTMISEQLWEPGAVGAKLITVKNDGNLAAKIKLIFAVEDGGLQDALWYDFVQTKGNAVVGTFTKREMSTLSAYCGALELPLLPQGTEGDSISFILLYGMNEEAGNEYQGKSFSADVTILAAQDTYESDGFDDQYDGDAAYPWDGVTVTPVTPDSNDTYNVSDGAELAWIAQEVNSGNSADKMTVVLQNDVDLNGKDWTPIGGANVFSGIIDGNGHTVKNLKVSKNTMANAGYEDRSIGLIGYAVDVTVKNLKIENCSVSGRYGVGAVVGEADGPIHFENIEILSGSMAADQDSAGNFAQVAGGILGIGYGAGTEYDGEIVFKNCVNRANITVHKQHAGGLWGSITFAKNADVKVENCHNYGNIMSLSQGGGGYAGGLGGYFSAKSLTITDSSNSGQITADKYVGNFVGFSTLTGAPVNE